MNSDFTTRFTEALTDLELRIARRADELVRASGQSGGLLEWWLQAEAEVLSEIPSLRRFVREPEAADASQT